MKQGSLFGNILNTFGTRTMTAVVNLAIAIVLSRFLGPAGKGQQGLIITTITFILVFANLVGGATLVYLAPRYPARSLLIPSYVWTVLVSMLAYPILYYLHLLPEEFVAHACILAVMNSFTAIHTSLLVGRERIKASNLINLLQPVVIITVLALMFTVYGRRDISSYIFALYLSFGFTMIVSYFLIRKYSRETREARGEDMFAIIRDLFRFGLLNQVAHITQMMSFRLSFYVLDHFHGEAAVGVYSNGISLAESVWLIAKSISLVQYARIANTEDRDYAQRLTLQLVKGSFILSMLVLIPLLAFPASVYTFVFGEGFGQVGQVIWYLAIGVLIYNISILLGHYFSGTGRYHINAIASSIGLVVSIVAFYLLIPSYSMMGAGAATSLSYLVTTVVLLVYFNKDRGNFLKEMMVTPADIRQVIIELKGYLKKD